MVVFSRCFFSVFDPLCTMFVRSVLAHGTHVIQYQVETSIMLINSMVKMVRRAKANYRCGFALALHKRRVPFLGHLKCKTTCAIRRPTSILLFISAVLMLTPGLMKAENWVNCGPLRNFRKHGRTLRPALPTVKSSSPEVESTAITRPAAQWTSTI